MLAKMFFSIAILSFSICHSKPSDADWQGLSGAVDGRLLHISTLNYDNIDFNNPFAIEELPWAMQATGWLNAWQLQTSPYVVAAKSTDDIVAAIRFAKKHHLRLSIKGTGHDYLGRSNGSTDALLLWTHHMRDITIHDSFIPKGAPPETKGEHAVTVQAGVRWGEVYREVMVNQGRYVQGGGCTSVGAAGGFLQGGGFGSFSKKFGLAAGSLLEAEVILADGNVVIANRYVNSDLFWALKGGGGSTFCVLSKATLQTHDLPKTFGAVIGKIQAHSDQAYLHLLEYFLNFYRDELNNEHWGEQITFKPDNSLQINMVFQGLSQEQASQVWSPFKRWIEGQEDAFKGEFVITVAPGQEFWSYEFFSTHAPTAIVPYREGKEGIFSWSGDQISVMSYWFTSQSRWLPIRLFQTDCCAQLANTIFQASRHWEFAIHIGKGLSGASPEAIQRSKDSSINSVCLDSAALAVFGAVKHPFYPWQQLTDSDKKEGLQQVFKVNTAMKILMDATPESGAYSNEADYFQKNWQQAFWGDNYPKLLEIKWKYDPDQFFRSHHSVGSEFL